MSRPYSIKIALALVATLTSLAWLSAPAHDGDGGGDEEEVHQAPAGGQAAGQGVDPGRPLVMPSGLVGLEIRLGLRDPSPTAWSGEVTVSEGRVLGLAVLDGDNAPEVAGSRFNVRTAPAATKKKAQAKKKQAKKKQAQDGKEQAGPIAPTVMLANLDAPTSATVTVATARGKFEARLADLPIGRARTFLDGEVSLGRTAASLRMTGSPTEDDYPAIATAPDGTAWLAYVVYSPEQGRLNGAVARKDYDAKLVPTKNGDQIFLRKYDGKAWSAAIPATAPRADVWRPTVAVDRAGDVHVAWAQQVDGNWDIYRRRYTPGREANAAGPWSAVERVTDHPGTDFHVVSTVDSEGAVWLAWQGWRDGQYDILARSPGGPGPRVVSNSAGDDWGPALASDGRGNVYVAWDTYDKGNFDVRVRNLRGDGPAIDVADSPRFEARVSLACDPAGRLWIAYEQGDTNWGKDYANGNPQRVPVKQSGTPLYLDRTVRVACLVDGKLQEPDTQVEAQLRRALNRKMSVPRLAADARHGVWLAVRHHPLPGGAGEAWVSSVLQFDGNAWHGPLLLPSSSNLLDNRPALSPVESGLLVVHSGDDRTATANRDQDDLHAAIVPSQGSAAGAPTLVARRAAPAADLPPPHTAEAADKARVRDYRVDHGGKSLRLLRGEFHRHTEFTSHTDQDGLLEDAWRYALDAGDLDWMGDGDHQNGAGHEYMWWLIQKSTDLHFNPSRFVPVHSYERSVVYPSGHRNVIMPRRGIRPLPIAANQFGTEEGGSPDVKNLYAYLKHFGGMCASHTGATDMGTDWRDNDPEVEPVVEIYQGHRHNYEHPGAPRSPTEATQIGGYQPKGFIWNALEKGYKLGFQSSSDHVSTHWSYAIVLTDDFSRQGLIDAFKKRHCYAATDNIVLDVRSGTHLMGDTFATGDRPAIRVTALGTAPIARLHVIRDNKYALLTEPNRDRVEFTYTDEDARAGETHYYYIRVEQADGNLAWASPMWITLEK